MATAEVKRILRELEEQSEFAATETVEETATIGSMDQGLRGSLLASTNHRGGQPDEVEKCLGIRFDNIG